MVFLFFSCVYFQTPFLIHSLFFFRGAPYSPSYVLLRHKVPEIQTKSLLCLEVIVGRKPEDPVLSHALFLSLPALAQVFLLLIFLLFLFFSFSSCSCLGFSSIDFSSFSLCFLFWKFRSSFPSRPSSNRSTQGMGYYHFKFDYSKFYQNLQILGCFSPKIERV